MRLDPFGTSMVVSAVLIDLYLATFIKSMVILYPTILLLSGAVFMRYYTSVKLDSTPARNNMFYYTMLGLLLVGGVAYVVPKLFVGSMLLETAGLTTLVLFYVLMAVSEEVFFRGFLQSFFHDRTHSMAFSVFLQALLWSVYHTAVYGSNNAVLMYVLLVGIILGYVDAETKSLTSSLVIHSLVNIIATVGMI